MKTIENLPKSPVTGISGTRLVETFSAQDIIRLYQLQEKMNVERYFKDEAVYLLECEKTGYRFFYPFDLAGDKEFYEELHVKSKKDGIEYDRENAEDHQFARQQIQPNEKVLEIGCGSGKFLQNISDITKNLCGLELNSLMAEIARSKGLDVKTKTIEEYAKEKPEAFDVICANQVLEHITDIKSFIDNALALLKPSGKLIFSVPNNEPYFQKFSKYEVLNLPPHHIGLWNLESFKNLSKVFDITLEKYSLVGQANFKANVYLRAKLTANVKSPPKQHSLIENLKILTVSPFALIRAGLDYFSDEKIYGHISVVFQKNK